MKEASQSTLMTEGVIWKKIVLFAMPVFWGNLLQQLYNIVDSLVVGNFVGDDALASVGSSGSLIFLLVGFFGGISVGAGVVISKYFGARDKENVERAVHTAVAFGIAAGVIVTVVGVLLSPQILKLMGTPDDVMEGSVLYLRTYFAGISTVVLYNTANGIYQAIGDSKHPLLFLLISSCTNVVLDLLFVVVFQMGIAGAALATVIAQGLSAFLAFFRLCRIDTEYKVVIKRIRFEIPILKQILTLGLPSGFQNSIIGFANTIVQSNINAFGSFAMAGCGAYFKLEGFGFLPITSFALAMTTFVGQNMGAKKPERVKKGVTFGIAACLIMAEAIGAVIFIFAPFLISLFNQNPQVIEYGVMQARTETLFYLFLAFSHIIAGALRGAGKSIVPMIVMMCCWCIIRVTYITTIVYFIPDIRCVFWAYPLTWTLSSIVFLIYFIKSDWLKQKKESPLANH